MTVVRMTKAVLKNAKPMSRQEILTEAQKEAEERAHNESRAEHQLAQFQERLESAKSECDKFAARFAGDPAGALEWANGVQGAAVKVKIYTGLIAMVATARENGATATEAMDKVIELARTNALRKAQYSIYRSSSMFANIMEEAKLNFWAELAENTFW